MPEHIMKEPMTTKQQKELADKLSKMSPEKIREFIQKRDNARRVAAEDNIKNALIKIMGEDKASEQLESVMRRINTFEGHLKKVI